MPIRAVPRAILTDARRHRARAAANIHRGAPTAIDSAEAVALALVEHSEVFISEGSMVVPALAECGHRRQPEDHRPLVSSA
jgi:hypothetical protein